MTPVEIRIMLLRKGLTITELARRCQASRVNVSRAVNGYDGGYRRLKRRMAEELGIPVEEIFPDAAEHQSIAA